MIVKLIAGKEVFIKTQLTNTTQTTYQLGGFLSNKIRP